MRTVTSGCAKAMMIRGATSMRGDGETVASGGERGLSRSPVWGGREPDRAEPSREMNRPPQGALGV